MSGIAYPRAFTAQNIISGFRVSEIYPFDREVFREDEFMGTCVTDRPFPPTKEGDRRPSEEGHKGPPEESV